MTLASTYRATYASKIRPQVCFSFYPGGPIYVAGNRFIKPGKNGYSMKFEYYGGKTRGRKMIRYDFDKARKRILILHDVDGPYYSAEQYAIDVFRVTVRKNGNYILIDTNLV